MECQFLFILLLTVSVKLVQAKTFTCAPSFQADACTITDVVSQDDRIVLSPQSPDKLQLLVILNSTMDDIPAIALNSSQHTLNLTVLVCDSCGLTGIKSSSFIPLSNLQALYISHGSYTKLQKNLFSKLPLLNNLNAMHGAITEVDANAFFNLTKLRYLFLSHNNISKITSKMFTPLESLVYLDLSHNHITILDNDLFVHNINLKDLHLAHNDINRIDGRLFNSQSVVSRVHLSYNELTILDTRNMENVYADYNRIKQLYISSTLQSLNAYHNDIQNVTCEEKGSPTVYLGLANNSLTASGCIAQLTQLTNLQLDYNNLGNLNQSSFVGLTELTSLGLKSANISKLEYGVFSHQKKLQSLDISYNHMGNVDMDILSASTDLQYLNIEGNNLTEFSYKDLRTTFTNLSTICIGDNDFNCTFLGEVILQLSNHDIKAVTLSGHSVTDLNHINGIRCHGEKETIPSWVPTSRGFNVKLNAVIHQVKKLSQIVAENYEKMAEDISAIKQQNFGIISDIIRMKAEILKIEQSTTNENELR